MTAQPPRAHEPLDPAVPILELLDGGHEEAAAAALRALHPAERASCMAGVDSTLRELAVRRFSPHELAEVLEFLEPGERALLIAALPSSVLAEIVPDVSDDIAADLVQALSGGEAAGVVAAIPAEARASLGELVGFAPDTAAGRMTGARVAVEAHTPVDDVIETLRAIEPAAQPPLIYVVDARGALVGAVNLRALLIAEPHTPVGAAAEELVTVTAETDQEDAARLLKLHNLAALPVVDDAGRPLGTLMPDDLLDVLEAETTEDMFRLAGVSADEDLDSIRSSVRYRLPWLYVNLLTVILAGFVVSLFADTLSRAAVLAAFLPVVGGQGGNAGIQTVTVVVRSLALGRLAARNTLRVVRHELSVALITGSVSGVAVGAVAWLWQGNPWLGALVLGALAGNVLIGAVAGVLIPMALQAAKQDPALSAGIWLTTVTDVCGFLLYLGFATLIITRL